MILLDGKLEININRAENLPDTDTAFFDIVDSDLTDPFVTVELDETELCQTKYINNCLCPTWNEKFNIQVNQKAKFITVNVKDKDYMSSEQIASVKFECDEVIKGDKIEGWFTLKHANENRGRIRMSIQFFPREC